MTDEETLPLPRNRLGPQEAGEYKTVGASVGYEDKTYVGIGDFP